MSEEQTEELDPSRITRWLAAYACCGDTGYGRCRSNIQWCKEEVKRPAGKGKEAYIKEKTSGNGAILCAVYLRTDM